MTQFIYHLIYLIKDKINSTDTTNQPYNIITLSDKIKDIKDIKDTKDTKDTKQNKSTIQESICDYDLMFFIHS